MPKRLSYQTLVDDAREQGLKVVDKGYGRHEIDRDRKGVIVYLSGSSWAFRRCDERYRPTPRCRLEAAYAYLGVSPGPGLFPRERSLIRSAMGLHYARRPYRNHFLCPEAGDDHATWQGLRARGLAVAGGKTSLGTYFHVTRAGAEAFGAKLKEEDVPDPVPDYGTPPRDLPEGQPQAPGIGPA